jgi:hypothetical protein
MSRIVLKMTQSIAVGVPPPEAARGPDPHLPYPIFTDGGHDVAACYRSIRVKGKT